MLTRLLSKKARTMFFNQVRYFGSDPLGTRSEMEDRMSRDPELAVKMMEHTKRTTSVRTLRRQEAGSLLHGVHGDIVFKYDLPVLNAPLKLRS